MDARPCLRQAVIVEGKYDKIKLETLIDALIIPTDGFRVFADREMRALIRKLAETCGLVVLTDSDAAGFLIRGHLKGLARPEQIVNVYIPDLAGKESRKSKPSKEGKLGVEGVPAKVLLDALRAAGLLEGSIPSRGEPITKQDLYEAGLSGGPRSATLRRALLTRLGLPARLSAGAMPAVLSRLISREEFFELCAEDLTFPSPEEEDQKKHPFNRVSAGLDCG